ncbi:MAG: pinensin family lanthipeptide [Cyclobacteriaceae bacterium]
MKKNKLKLNDLRLKSFVTGMDAKLEETVKGGISSSPEELRSVRELCPTNLIFCR